MKKITISFMLLVSIISMVLLSSCVKDNAEFILGKWHFEKMTCDVTSDDLWFLEYANETYDSNEYLEGSTFEFKSDNTLIYYNPKEGDTESLPYSIEGDQLVFDGTTYTIKSLTKRELVFEWSDTIFVNYTSGLVVTTYEYRR